MSDEGAIGQEMLVYHDNGKVLCKGFYEGTREGRIWLKDDKGMFHSFPADKYDMRPATK